MAVPLSRPRLRSHAEAPSNQSRPFSRPPVSDSQRLVTFHASHGAAPTTVEPIRIGSRRRRLRPCDHPSARGQRYRCQQRRGPPADPGHQPQRHDVDRPGVLLVDTQCQQHRERSQHDGNSVEATLFGGIPHHPGRKDPGEAGRQEAGQAVFGDPAGHPPAQHHRHHVQHQRHQLEHEHVGAADGEGTGHQGHFGRAAVGLVQEEHTQTAVQKLIGLGCHGGRIQIGNAHRPVDHPGPRRHAKHSGRQTDPKQGIAGPRDEARSQRGHAATSTAPTVIGGRHHGPAGQLRPACVGTSLLSRHDGHLRNPHKA